MHLFCFDVNYFFFLEKKIKFTEQNIHVGPGVFILIVDIKYTCYNE